MNIHENIDSFILDLLHIDDVKKNKLVDLNAGDVRKTFYVYHKLRENISRYVLGIISDRIGKPGNTVLRRSSDCEVDEQIIGKDVNDLDWKNGAEETDPSTLKRFIESVYSELSLKGNNPLFLSIGTLTWKVASGKETKVVSSPLVLFPIRLIRSSVANTPVYIEFINEDVYFNPCLMAKLRQVVGDEVVDAFPHPNGKGVSVDEPLDLNKLSTGDEYFELVQKYVEEQKREDISTDTVFEFNKDVVAIAQYNHDELCVYYDIKRNKEKIYKHPLVNRIFNKCETAPEIAENNAKVHCILPRDSVQERIIKRVVNGESLIIKGPPGTGKTLTITNMIASLLAANKKVLLSSKKIAAMSEIYAKLPTPLRKFVMMLVSETEAQAAALNPVEVKKELRSLIDQKKTFTLPKSASEEYSRGIKDASSAISAVKKYTTETFEEQNVLGSSYYDALDVLCKIDTEPILFAEPQEAINLSREDYLKLHSKVGECAEHYNILSKNHGVRKSPWYPLNSTFDECNVEKAYSDYSRISALLNGFLTNAEFVLSSLCERYGDIPISLVEFLVSETINEKQIESVASKANDFLIDSIIDALNLYLKEEKIAGNKLKVSEDADVSVISSLLSSAQIDLSLTAEEFTLIYDNLDAISRTKEPKVFKALSEILTHIRELNKKLDEERDAFYSIVRKDLSENDLTIVNDATARFISYKDKNKATPSFLDFKGKKLYSAFKNLGYGNEISFKDAINVSLIKEEIKATESQIDALKVRISSVFNIKFTEEQLKSIFFFVKQCVKFGRTVEAYLTAFERDKIAVKNAIAGIEKDGEFTLLELTRAYRKAVAQNDLNELVARFTNSREEFNNVAPILVAKSIKAIRSLVGGEYFGKNAVDIALSAQKLYENGFTLKKAIADIKLALDDFENNHFATYYTQNYESVIISDLKILIEEASDREVLNAALGYISAKNTYPLSLDRFFRPFEYGLREPQGYTFEQLFEHSVYALAVKAKMDKMGVERNGLGNRISRALLAWGKSVETVNDATVSLIENQCMSRITASEQDFAFLNAERGKGESLRKIFKNYSKQILKLKKCFILSPSSASIFFNKDDFSDFDVLIVDEASQLEPTSILPVLFRAKQVIMVGDEWQMPPIKNFAVRSEKTVIDEDGGYEILNPNTSVLSLALSNCAFPTEHLVCHYRSKTESLIAFSQKMFYEHMRTFPSPLPKTEGLGFKDVFVESGFCENGVNVAEAEQVIEELKLHFNKYYDDEKGVLRESVGVVAFGKSQLDYILALKERDCELREKIRTALSNYDDVPEKKIFFKTIKTVQGQEIEHLILSLTYGRNEHGTLVQSFGELNMGADENKLGQCIFNVAITRAKSSVTLLHSVKAEDITNPTVKYLSEYLDTVRIFSKEGKSQFAGKSIHEERTGFIRQVAEFITSCGIDPKRIVIDCGVTEGSVKLPIVILNKSQTAAEFTIWCEKPLKKDYDYIDYNLKYVEILRSRNWVIRRLYAHDWVDNNLSEKKALKTDLEKYVTI